VKVCQYDVFVVRKADRGRARSVGLLARFKVFVHGGKQGFVTRPPTVTPAASASAPVRKGITHARGQPCP